MRAALADDAKQPRYIETAARRGYRFIGRFIDNTNDLALTPVVSPLPATDRPVPVQRAFIGREAPLDKLRSAWQRAINGERQLVWIAGEASICRLHAHTDGLPLFVANVADALLAQTTAQPSTANALLEDSSNTPLPVPENLAGVIEKQIARLPFELQLREGSDLPLMKRAAELIEGAN